MALENEADVNNKAKDGTPVFMVACETANENEDMCLTLLAKGAQPDCRVEVSKRYIYLSPIKATVTVGEWKLYKNLMLNLVLPAHKGSLLLRVTII